MNNRRAKWFIRIICIILALAMIIPLAAGAFGASPEETVEVPVQTESGLSIGTLPWYIYIIAGVVLLASAIILKKRDDKRPKNSLEGKTLLKDYKKNK